jgi:acetoin utilization deacetylase AcuC-like enzyme
MSNRSSFPVFVSPAHALHSEQIEFLDQKLMPSFEAPGRIDLIQGALEARGFSSLVPVRTGDSALLATAHEPAYVEAMRRLSAELGVARTDNQPDTILAATWTENERILDQHPPRVRFGRWAKDTFTSIGPGTFDAAAASATCVATAAAHVASGASRGAFVLSRPPHHHAGPDSCNGYCYFNGTATAALLTHGSGRRCAVLDVDFHHGNGTQDILYRTNILFSSIHGDPRTSFPYYSGHADEKGEGEGAGFTLNIPLPDGTAWDLYREALAAALAAIRHYGPDLLIVSLGVDTFKDDPVGRFVLESEDFLGVGSMIGALQVPTLFVMEGGYGVPQIGVNVANVLEGHLGATRPAISRDGGRSRTARSP